MSQWPTQQEVKAMAKQLDTNIVMVGNRVYEACQYTPEISPFTRQKFLLLAHYHSGISLQEAADKVNMDLTDAANFVDSPKAVEWLQKKALRDYAKQEWEDGGKWIEMGDDCLSGKKHLAKDQQIVFQAFGERFFPKKKEASEGAKTVINFNFSAEAVKEAFRRQEAIDTELAQ